MYIYRNLLYDHIIIFKWATGITNVGSKTSIYIVTQMTEQNWVVGIRENKDKLSMDILWNWIVLHKFPDESSGHVVLCYRN